MKPVSFLGDSLDRLRRFPAAVRRELGFQIERVQRGLEPTDWKPMKSIGQGVREIRVRDASGAFRVIYIASLSDAVYVLNVFQKKARQTPTRELELAASRLKQLGRRMR